MAGWFPLFASSLVETPMTPVIAVSSPVSDTTPTFSVYGQFQTGDDLQFERRAYDPDNNWTGATVSNHTLTAPEVSGSPVSLSLATLTPGDYQYRVKHKHAGGNYSSYSPLETSTIDTSLQLTLTSVVAWAGTGGGTNKTATASLGNPYSSRRVFIFGILADDGASAHVSDVKINGVSAAVTQASTGYDLHWMATAIVATGTTASLELIYDSGAFATGPALVYVCGDTTLNSATPIDIDHVSTTSTTSATMNIATDAVGSCVFLGAIIGGTSGNPSITSNDDTFTIDLQNTNAFLGGHVNGTLSRTAQINVGWTPAADGRFTAWSFK